MRGDRGRSAHSLEGVGSVGNQDAQDIKSAEDQDAEELANMVRELEIAEFCNVNDNTLYHPIPHYTTL